MTIPNAPAGYSTINPFLITRDADDLIRFLTEVFDGIDHPDARTIDDDGLLLHAELQIGGTTVMFAERKPGWPFLPALLQVYVDDVDTTLERAASRGAEIVTRPTEFFGDIFSRFIDPWQNMWWVYSTQSTPDAAGDDEAESDWADATADAEAWEPTPELTYIHDTLLEALPRLRESPA